MIDDAVADPTELATTLRPKLSAHPVPQSDPRTRGLLVETAGLSDDRAWLGLELWGLGERLAGFAAEPGAVFVIAVNETPPTSPDCFLLRPHVDRRWLAGGFARRPPSWTTVVFLEFPPRGFGGELVVFPRGAFEDSAPVPRKDARGTVVHRGGVLIPPRPGRACRFAGDLPHAVLGYSAAPDDAWRLAIVIAKFTPDPDEPPPRGWLVGPDVR